MMVATLVLTLNIWDFFCKFAKIMADNPSWDGEKLFDRLVLDKKDQSSILSSREIDHEKEDSIPEVQLAVKSEKDLLFDANFDHYWCPVRKILP